MNSNPLESATAKIDRAKENLHSLDSEIQSAGSDKAHGISFRHQSQTDELVMTVLTPHRLFVRYAILAGEVVHQARSALNHAVWELVPNPVHGRTGFPVFTVETQADAAAQRVTRYYDRDGVRMIDGINPAAATVIKGLQPFGSHCQTNPLYILNELWNRDKHRLLNTCKGGNLRVRLDKLNIGRRLPMHAIISYISLPDTS